MMKWALPWLCISLAQAGPYDECPFILSWARQAMYIAKKIELPEENWRITEDGFEPEEYAAIIRIKHEAYHDVKALTLRVERACAQKSES